MRRVAGIAVFILSGAAWAQDNGEFKARDMFNQLSPPPMKTNTKGKDANGGKSKPVVTPPRKNPSTDTVVSNNSQTNLDQSHLVQPVSYAPLALRYTILQEKGGAFVEVDPNTEFHTGDRIRVRVETNGEAYLYIVEGGASGQWQVLFPSKHIFNGNNQIAPRVACTIPPESDVPFRFDSTTGVEKISLVLSRTQEADLEKLIYEAGDPTRKDDKDKNKLVLAQNIPDAVMGHVREQVRSRDLVVDNGPTTPEGTKEKAVYAATPDQTNAARLFVDLTLHHTK